MTPDLLTELAIVGEALDVAAPPIHLSEITTAPALSNGPRPPRWPTLVAATSVIVIAIGALVWTRDRADTNTEIAVSAAPSASSSPSVPIAPSHPAVPADLPDDLVYRGARVQPSVPNDGATFVADDATISVNVAPPGTARTVPRPTDVESALRSPRLATDDYISVDWSSTNGSVLAVEARRASERSPLTLDDVAGVARQLAALHTSGSVEFEAIEPPAGYELYTSPVFSADGVVGHELELRWSNAAGTRHLTVLTRPSGRPTLRDVESDTTAAPTLIDVGGLGVPIIEVPLSNGVVAQVKASGLTDDEVRSVIASLRLDVSAPSPPTPEPTTHVAPPGSEQVFDEGMIDSARWELVGRTFDTGGPEIVSVSELRSGENAADCGVIDAYVQPVSAETLVVGTEGRGVLHLCTTNAASAVTVRFLDRDGALVIESTSTGLDKMTAAGFAPSAAFEVPVGVDAAELTVTALDGTVLADVALGSDVLTPHRSEG